MCEEYSKNEENKKFIAKAKKYYDIILQENKVNLKIKEYFKILMGKNQFKKSIREIILFHFPIFGYLKFTRIKNKER